MNIVLREPLEGEYVLETRVLTESLKFAISHDNSHFKAINKLRDFWLKTKGQRICILMNQQGHTESSSAQRPQLYLCFWLFKETEDLKSKVITF